MTRVCIDLTANEMRDRFGGIGRYGYHLLQAMLALPASERAGIELCALESSDAPVLSAERALEKAVLGRPPIPSWRHRWQRRLFSGGGLAQGKVDLFHAVQPVALPWLAHAKVLATCHDLIPVVFPRPDGPLMRSFITLRETASWAVRMHRADHILAISEQTAQDLSKRLGIRPSKISVVYHGVDPERFDLNADVGAARRKFALPERWFISVGSDHYRKNHKLLLDAWCSVSHHVPEGLVFVGKALYDSTLHDIDATSEKLGLRARVRWLDDVDDQDLPALYRGATAAIAPSLYEGFGMTLLEAMACGTPVAAARNGAYEEVGGEAALYFSGRSQRELEATLRDLSRDSRLCERLRHAGLKRAREMTWERTAQETLRVYRQVSGEAPR